MTHQMNLATETRHNTSMGIRPELINTDHYHRQSSEIAENTRNKILNLQWT